MASRGTPSAVTTENPSFFSRIALAFGLFFKILFDAPLAGRLERVSLGGSNALPPPPPTRVPEPPPTRPNQVVVPEVVAVAPVLREVSNDTALQVLALLQREGRLIDFLEEDSSAFSDADIGAAARVVHAGCRKALKEHFTLAPVRTETEESRVTVGKGFAASEIRLTGNVTGEAPFTGTLRHRGWRVTEVRLPKLAEGHDVRVIAPAEVEL